MQVETFECSETAAEPIEASEEAIGLIEELGLTGQKSLVTQSQKTERDTRCPYRKITNEEKFVYKTLCPSETEISRYSQSPIPLRVLQVAAHAKSLGIFKDIYVWDRESVVVKDPVLIGVMAHREYSWARGDEFILARWGEELETFATLLKRACTSARERLTNEAEQLLRTVTGLHDAQIVAAGADKRIAWE